MGTSPSIDQSTASHHYCRRNGSSQHQGNSSSSSHPDDEDDDCADEAGRKKKSKAAKGKIGKSSKPPRVRTVMSDVQLRILKQHYMYDPRPDAYVKDHLKESTGLTLRVIRVWFQNKRCKEKKRLLKEQNEQMVFRDQSSQCITSMMLTEAALTYTRVLYIRIIWRRVHNKPVIPDPLVMTTRHRWKAAA
ncbi:Homeobox domain, partial [Trinorchestia longiramus]